jgi:hypothetical protein
LKHLKYLVLNSILALSLWFGLVEGIQGALNLGLFMSWLVFVLSLTLLSDDVVERGAKEGLWVPIWFDTLFDSFIVGLLAWHSCFWTAGVYFIHMCILVAYRSKVQDKISNTESEEKCR